MHNGARGRRVREKDGGHRLEQFYRSNVEYPQVRGHKKAQDVVFYKLSLSPPSGLKKQWLNINAALRARRALMSQRNCRSTALQSGVPRRRAAHRDKASRTTLVSGCSRPQQLHGIGLY